MPRILQLLATKRLTSIYSCYCLLFEFFKIKFFFLFYKKNCVKVKINILANFYLDTVFFTVSKRKGNPFRFLFILQTTNYLGSKPFSMRFKTSCKWYLLILSVVKGNAALISVFNDSNCALAIEGKSVFFKSTVRISYP